MIDINKRIMDLRESKDYPQIELAKVLGCSKSNYNHIEKCKIIPTPNQIDILANLYETSSDYVVGITNDRISHKVVGKYNLEITAGILKKLREEKGLTQQEIADNVINSSQSIYNRYEKKILKANIITLIELAKFYNVSLDYILGRTKIKNPYSINTMK